MKFSASLATLFAAGALANPVPQDGPPAGKVYVKSVKANGSGCPANSVQTQFNSEGTVLTLLFSKYEATIGPQSKSRSDARKNCQINLLLSYPAGYRYTVVGVLTRGYADIDAGITGEIVSNYYFSGQTEQVTSRASINGPFHDQYKKDDKINLQTYIWSPCGKDTMANINTDVRLTSNNQQAGGLLTVDSIDAKFDQKIQYQLRWRSAPECPKNRRVVDPAPVFEGIQTEDSSAELAESSLQLGA
ncbi:hypothetical protein EJ08DRAFT_487364 [Tothia fuscella]|uniref:Secreted protein n=1 Tax=Tothia fuscella TaxID=1048955 RepID=A0A9P4TU62_9PEZI|nr:hypothetical protein EJ08DRAFT_487364 [Tothia fuscella]